MAAKFLGMHLERADPPSRFPKKGEFYLPRGLNIGDELPPIRERQNPPCAKWGKAINA